MWNIYIVLVLYLGVLVGFGLLLYVCRIKGKYDFIFIFMILFCCKYFLLEI